MDSRDYWEDEHTSDGAVPIHVSFFYSFQSARK